VNRAATLCAAGALAGGVLVGAQALPEPPRQFGASVTGAFEGWFENPDKTRSFLVGYFNRNTTQALDVPVGPNNRIEPGGPDLGQPTHFLPGRQWGMFVIPVPRDFTPEQRLIWTLVANGQTTSIPLRLHPDYLISPFTEIAVRNTPPVIRFDPGGPVFQGPVARIAAAPARTASLAVPLALTLRASDDLKYTSGSSIPPSASRQPVTVRWSKYRGPGTVTFDQARPRVEPLGPAGSGSPAFDGQAATNVRFSEVGDYLIHLTANDYSGDGGGGFVCCWTTALVKVSVTR
jgi:hypothetical protein